MATLKKILIICSGHSAKEYANYDYKGNGWIVVAVNNGWVVCEDSYDYWFHANDYKGMRPQKAKQNQVEIKKYGPSINKFGGHRQCGYSIALCAGYYCLDTLKPNVIGYLGADMNYTPDENGHTHFYGVGYDIQHKGISDPDAMVMNHGKNDPDYLENIYNRFATIAAEHKCHVYNLSSMIETRLPYMKNRPEMIDDFIST